MATKACVWGAQEERKLVEKMDLKVRLMPAMTRRFRRGFDPVEISTSSVDF